MIINHCNICFSISPMRRNTWRACFFTPPELQNDRNSPHHSLKVGSRVTKSHPAPYTHSSLLALKSMQCNLSIKTSKFFCFSQESNPKTPQVPQLQFSPSILGSTILAFPGCVIFLPLCFFLTLGFFSYHNFCRFRTVSFLTLKVFFLP